MKKLIFITILITSCSVFKHKTTSSSSQKDLTVHAVQRRDSLQLTAQSQRIHFLSDDQLELTEIIPQGKFTYQPDSGFAGEAAQVKVYRRRQLRSLESDTATLHQTRSHERKILDGTYHQQAQQQLEETRKSKPATTIWVYILAAVLLVAGWVWWKR